MLYISESDTWGVRPIHKSAQLGSALLFLSWLFLFHQPGATECHGSARAGSSEVTWSCGRRQTAVQRLYGGRETLDMFWVGTQSKALVEDVNLHR